MLRSRLGRGGRRRRSNTTVRRRLLVSRPSAEWMRRRRLWIAQRWVAESQHGLPVGSRCTKCHRYARFPLTGEGVHGSSPPSSGRPFFGVGGHFAAWNDGGVVSRLGEMAVARARRHGEAGLAALADGDSLFAPRREFGAERPLRCASKLDQRQMPALAEMLDDEREVVTPLGPATRHPRPRLESPSRRPPPVEHFLGSPSEQVRVRAGAVVPGGVRSELAPHGPVGHRDERQPSRALLLQRTDEALDDADARRLSEVAVPRPDRAALAPALERPTLQRSPE